MVTHYEPYSDPEEYPQGWCGTPSSENTQTTRHWEHVTCKKCLKVREKINATVKQIEEHIINDMKGFVEFCKTEENG